MNLKRALLTLAALVFPFGSYAGVVIVGNGGDAVVCRAKDTSVISVEVLDLYEARTLRKMSIKLGDSRLHYLSKVQLAVDRLKTLSPERWRRYSVWLGSFEKETRFLSGIRLSDISDSDHIAVPKDCAIEQLVSQSEPLIAGEARYTFNDDLWSLLSEDGKAAIVLHEFVYRDTLQMGHLNSVAARVFNSYLLSDGFAGFTKQEFINLLIGLKFDSVEAQGVLIRLFDKTDPWKPTTLGFHSGQIVSNGKVVDGSVFNALGAQLKIVDEVEFYANGQVKTFYLQSDAEVSVQGQKVTLKSGIVQLHESGKLMKAIFLKPLTIETSTFKGAALDATHLGINDVLLLSTHATGSIFFAGEWKRIKERSVLKAFSDESIQLAHLEDTAAVGIGGETAIVLGKIEFFSTARLKSCNLFKDASLLVQSRLTAISSLSEVSFYPNGVLKKACVAEKASFKNATGALQKVHARDLVEFDDTGALLYSQSGC